MLVKLIHSNKRTVQMQTIKIIYLAIALALWHVQARWATRHVRKASSLLPLTEAF
jgi:hypothetical protein